MGIRRARVAGFSIVLVLLMLTGAGAPARGVPAALPAAPGVPAALPAAPGVPAAPEVPAAPGAPGALPAAAAAPAYRWPLDGAAAVVRPFDPPARRWLPGHRGVDLAAAPGTVVRAAGAGVVRFAGTVAGRGVVSVAHADGLRTTYEPVSPLVQAGQRVRAGDPIGLLVAGHEGCPAPACLHWGLRHGDVYLDPLSLLGAGRVRLLPLESPGAARQPAASSAGSRSASRSYSSARL
jgi:murein DD-endopeptidase MepM/ murein hydrolase activator NlpD